MEAKANNGEQVCDGMLDHLCARVNEHAIQKRLDEIAKKESFKMESDQVRWGDEEVNGVGKGKGKGQDGMKGKGMKGPCWTYGNRDLAA